jgi:acetyl esterase/lipase
MGMIQSKRIENESSDVADGADDARRDVDGVTRVRLLERMNSPLEIRKVRLRGLGGPAVCGVPNTRASATGTIALVSLAMTIPRERHAEFPASSTVSARPGSPPLESSWIAGAPRTGGHNPRRRISRLSSGDFNRSRNGLGALAEWMVPRGFSRLARVCISAALAATLGGCAARLAPGDAQALGDVLFAPPTQAEMCAVEAEWARRDTRSHDARVEWRDEGRGGRTIVLSHTVDGLRHYGGVRIPPGAEGRRLPVLVITHGGDKGTSGYNFVRSGPIAEGWIQVLPSYRSERLTMRPLRRYRSQGRPSPWDRDVDDAMALLSTALAQVPEADTARIAVFGRSRGGGVALLMAIRDPRVKGVVDYNGPTDFYLPEVRRLADRALRSRIPKLPGAGYLADSVLFALRDGRTTVERARSELLRRSPVYFAHRLPPTQIHHGTRDDEVPIVHSQRLIGALTGIGRAAPLWEMVTYPGGGHRPHTLTGAPQRVDDWLQRVIASGTAPPRTTPAASC